MQMTQFCLNMVQASVMIYVISKSSSSTPYYPVFIAYLLFGYMITMLVLFGNFFVHDRRRARAAAAAAKASGKTNTISASSASSTPNSPSPKRKSPLKKVK